MHILTSYILKMSIDRQISLFLIKIGPKYKFDW